MKYRTREDRPDKSVAEEKVSKDTIVETAGYIPADVRIKSLFDAGQRLVDYRKAQFDLNPEDPLNQDFVPDITRASNFDMADATMLARNVTGNLRNAASEAKAKADAAKKASQTAPEGSGEAEKQKEGGN